MKPAHVEVALSLNDAALAPISALKFEPPLLIAESHKNG